MCEALSIPVKFLESYVVEGVQKRLDRLLDREVLTARLRAGLTPRPNDEPERTAVEQELGETRLRIERLVDAFAAGPEDLPSIRAALARLERERGRPSPSSGEGW